MKKMIVLTLILEFTMATLSSCTKIDVPKGTPKCIKKKIKQEKDKCLDKVYEYQYNGGTVYLFVPANKCIDAGTVLYSDDCTYVCSPTGGMTGAGDGKCSDFYKIASNEKLIWSNN